MTKKEFLDKLKSALGNDLNSAKVQENVSYYNEYIDDEVRKGRTEAEVVEELGDPWAIAKTISDSEETQSAGQNRSVYESGNTADDGTSGQRGNVHVFHLNSKWKVALILLGILGIIFLLVAVIGGIVSFLAPALVPILIIICVIRLLGKRK